MVRLMADLTTKEEPDWAKESKEIISVKKTINKNTGQKTITNTG